MGNIFVGPKKIPLNIVHTNPKKDFATVEKSENFRQLNIVHTNPKNGFTTVEKSKNSEIQNITIKPDYVHTLQIVTETYETHILSVLEDGCLARTSRKRPLDKDSEDDDKFLDKKLRCLSLLDNIQFSSDEFFTNSFSFQELVETLTECSNSDGSLSSDEYQSDNSATGPIDIVYNGTKSEIRKLPEDELQFLLLKEKIHLKLAGEPENYSKMTLLIDAAVYMLGEIIDLRDDEGNTALSIALLKSNIRAFIYLLIKRNAKIPLYIYKEKKKIPFLIYIALNGKMTGKNNMTEYLLVEILNILIQYYPRERVCKHLCIIDNESGLSLPHMLITIYQKQKDLRSQITECLEICIKECPESADILCMSYYCQTYKFKLVAHTIILPETNYRIIKACMKNTNQSVEDKELLRSLVKVHQDREKRDNIIKIIG